MIIVNYHELSARGGSSRYDLSTRLFRRQLDVLIGHGFSFVTLDEVVQSQTEEQPRQCAITFDDGRLGAYEHGATILREYGITATFFIPADWMETKPTSKRELYSDFMTWDQLAALARDGHVIGSHGKGHLPLLHVDAEALHSEIRKSKRLIEERLAVACEHFAAPWGQTNRTITSLVRDSGYKTLSTTVSGPNKIPYQLHRLRRFDSASYGSPEAFESAVLAAVDEHSRCNVVLLDVVGRCEQHAGQIEELARFDVAICLSEPAYEFCIRADVPCLRHSVQRGSDVASPTGLLMNVRRQLLRDREITVTRLTLRESHSPWTYLSSFLPGTSRIR